MTRPTVTVRDRCEPPDDVFALRRRVFVDEQGVPGELELDGHDGEQCTPSHATATTLSALVDSDDSTPTPGQSSAWPCYRSTAARGSVVG